MNQSGRPVSEQLGIRDPVVALDVDTAAALRWRRVEDRKRREWDARKVEALAILVLSGLGGKMADARELLGLAAEDEADAEAELRRRIESYEPTPAEREYVDAGEVFELRKRAAQAGAEGDAGKVEIIAAG